MGRKAQSVADGQYYVYAVISDGTHSVTAYSNAKITIDKNKTDTDNDQLSDLWELFNYDTLIYDGNSDTDSDGVPAVLEEFYGTDPTQANSPLGTLDLALKKGANVIGVPGMLVPKTSSYDLLNQLGTAVSSISRYNRSTKMKETTYWQNSQPTGDLFYLMPGEGYFVEMASAGDVVWNPFNTYKSVTLTPGLNVIALTNPTGDSFGYLDQLGKDVVWSIRRMNPKTGLNETSAFDGDKKVGVPFQLNNGEGYIITVK